MIRIVKEILESASACLTREREIQQIITCYEEPTALKGDYLERLSSRDYYSFKDEFEKLHLRATSKTILPELLRNNYLEDLAL